MDHRATIDHYERVADEYAQLISPEPPVRRAQALGRLRALVPHGGRVLEIGSGTGRDADHLERHGVVVRRTDATRAFADMQRARGRRVDLLDVTADDLGGPYDAVLAMCALMHVDPAALPQVLRRVAGALVPGGALLVSVREGDGGTPPPAPMWFWRAPDFGAVLAEAGLSPTWEDHHDEDDGEAWLTVLATAA